MVLVCSPTLSGDLYLGQAIKTVADRLYSEQVKQGTDAGVWPGANDYTGSIASGMVNAYEPTCNEDYRKSAEQAGNYILLTAQGNFYGDEAYALTRLSDISSDPHNNPWRKAASDFYSNVRAWVGTTNYIAQFAGADSSTAVFYLSNHVVAAYYVDAKDRQIWRQGLIDGLAKVDDNSSDCPVMALGIATWALALTGRLDEMLIDSSGAGAEYWVSKRLADLPSLLLSHQVPEGETYAGSFYWRFDHTDGGSSSNKIAGYTEDAIFSTLGLTAASMADPNLYLDDAVFAARDALLGGIDPQGKVQEHLSRQGATHYAYAGEMLAVLGELIIRSDLNLDGVVDFADLAILGKSLRTSGCTTCSSCSGADLNHDSKVDLADVEIMTNSWLRGVNNQRQP